MWHLKKQGACFYINCWRAGNDKEHALLLNDDLSYMSSSYQNLKFDSFNAKRSVKIYQAEDFAYFLKVIEFRNFHIIRVVGDSFRENTKQFLIFWGEENNTLDHLCKYIRNIFFGGKNTIFKTMQNYCRLDWKGHDTLLPKARAQF